MNKNDFRYWTDTIEHIMASDRIVIYGAGTMGKAVRKCLTEEPYNRGVQCFIVKSLDDNDHMVDGLSVIDIDHAGEYKDATVLIALNGKLIPEVIEDLSNAGFMDIVPISFDGDEWTAIRGNWFKVNGTLPKDISYFGEMTSDDQIVISDSLEDRLHLYVAHSIYDRKLSEEPVDKPYEISIQVGSALTNKVIYEIRDSLGEDNISNKNRQYCELTGIYWAWKNDEAEYIGFSHYRRRFVLSEDQVKFVTSDKVDVIVTEPLVNFATVKGQYAKDHIAEDWDVLLDVINELAPQYLASAQKVQESVFYFAYNMFIMKKKIFDEYCSFLFPILRRCEELIGEHEDVYQNRYVGFLAERLLNVFLVENTGYKVIIADKHFIE